MSSSEVGAAPKRAAQRFRRGRRARTRLQRTLAKHAQIDGLRRATAKAAEAALNEEMLTIFWKLRRPLFEPTIDRMLALCRNSPHPEIQGISRLELDFLAEKFYKQVLRRARAGKTGTPDFLEPSRLNKVIGDARFMIARRTPAVAAYEDAARRRAQELLDPLTGAHVTDLGAHNAIYAPRHGAPVTDEDWRLAVDHLVAVRVAEPGTVRGVATTGSVDIFQFAEYGSIRNAPAKIGQCVRNADRLQGGLVRIDDVTLAVKKRRRDATMLVVVPEGSLSAAQLEDAARRGVTVATYPRELEEQIRAFGERFAHEMHLAIQRDVDAAKARKAAAGSH